MNELAELLKLIEKSAQNKTVRIPMELAVRIAFELDKLNRVRETLKEKEKAAHF